MKTVGGKSGDRRRKALGRGRAALAAGITGAVVLLDQVTKLWADRTLAGSPPVTVIENFFHFTYHRNTGGVFGLFAGSASMGRKFFFVAFSCLALVLVLHLIREWGRESLLALSALALISGGALGNLVDRVAYGEVIDFIDWHWYSHHWPTFNIADSSITVGTAILVFTVLRTPSRT